jgi:23S rRNA pseudouridine2605 synthase
MKERIQKLLANAGVSSRRNVEELVRQGRIAVNGRIVIDLPILVDPGKDRVELDGERVLLDAPETARRMYFILNKPKGVYSTNVAQGEQTRAIDLLPPDLPGRVYPVGRLDVESKGLLLLTNDGDLTNKLTHPRYGVTKTYRAMVDGFVTPQVIKQIEQGVWISDSKTGKGFKTARCRIRVVKRVRDKSVVEISVREGRNTQVRRLFARVGHKVRELTRVKMGPLTIDGLDTGEFRPLTGREVRALQNLSSESEKPRSRKEAT